MYNRWLSYVYVLILGLSEIEMISHDMMVRHLSVTRLRLDSMEKIE
jgi:hypothetical protein